MKTYHLLTFLLILPLCLFSQVARLNKDCEFANEIIIEKSGIHAVSKSASDTLTTDVKTNTVLYSYADQSQSFWYKIYANDNCEIAFDIYPEKPNNTFNYFLYKVPANLKISEIESKNIAPLRANLYKDDMFTSGTGLSLSSDISYNNVNSEDRVKDFYYTPYHSAVPAKNGDVYMLNIYHVEGTDCGYRFIMKNEKFSQKFKAIFHHNYAKELAKTKISKTIYLNPRIKSVAVVPKELILTKTAVSTNSSVLPATPAAAIQTKKEDAKFTCIVKDSVKRSTLVADITCLKKQKSANFNSRSDEKGTYQIILEKHTSYTLVISALGYKSKTVSFATKEELNSFTQNILLSPLMEGDDFVMDKIYFYPNTYAMKPGALEELDKLVSYLKMNPGIKVEIQGHTSGNKRIKADNNQYEEGSFTGSSKKLSQIRAETIKKYLIEKGISGERLSPIGYGGSEMIYRHPKNQAEANKNIRVAIRILPQKENILSSRAGKEK